MRIQGHKERWGAAEEQQKQKTTPICLSVFSRDGIISILENRHQAGVLLERCGVKAMYISFIFRHIYIYQEKKQSLVLVFVKAQKPQIDKHVIIGES